MATAASQRLSLRPYQHECVSHAMKENTIVHLDTGLGKTLIAAKIIENYLNRSPKKRGVFLVPTQALVDQHEKNCRNEVFLHVEGSDGCRPPRVLTMVGNEQAGWTQKEWQESVDNHDIFVGTPEIFRKALIDHGYISVEQFCVFVFDECHKATGRHPMAMILQYAIHPYSDRHGESFRILGLTASFTSGKATNLEKKRKELERLLRATILCPTVPEEFINLKSDIRIVYGSNSAKTEKQVAVVRPLLNQCLETVGKSKDVKKVVNASVRVLEELGKESLLYYVKHTIVDQIEHKISNFSSQGDEHAKKAAENLRHRLPLLREAISIIAAKLEHSGISKNPSSMKSPKLERLLDLLRELFTEHHETTIRGMIFVKEVALAPTIAKQINSSDVGIVCSVLAGTSSQSTGERQDNVSAFPMGHLESLCQQRPAKRESTYLNVNL